ncbi:MAG TPA: PAS domain S-box protein, partial [Methanospirillum sp.]|uniref:PAS domain S-box protein n=1 Tax=Methanospirillum sp. TaxID=45200 RepID=UPI002CBF3D31
DALNNGADFYLKKTYEIQSQIFELTQIIKMSVSRAQSEESLKKSEEKFRTITEYSHEWVYWRDQNGTMVYVSPSCEEVTGYTPKEFYQDPDLRNKIILEEDIPLWITHTQNCSKEITSSWLDYRIVRKDGCIRWIGHVCQPIYDSKGNYAGKIVSNRDITIRKNMENLLRTERNNFLQVFRAAPVGLILLNTDTVITQANKALSELILLDPADIIRKRGGGGLGCIHSEEDPRGCGYSSSCPNCPLRTGIEAVIKDGVSIHGTVIPLTLMIEGHPSLRWLSINAEPVEIECSSYVIVAIDDITEEKEIESALQASEEKFRALSDSTTAGIMMYQDDAWTYANPAALKISGYSQDELLSMKFWEVIDPTYQKQYIALGQARLRGDEGMTHRYELPIIRKNGEIRWLECVGSTITIGKKKAGLITAIDITEHKIADENLERSEKRYRSIFENFIDLFFQTDMDGIIQALSPSCTKLTGWEVSDLVGTSALRLYPNPDDRYELVRLLLVQERILDYETTMLTKTGYQVPVSINCQIVRDQENNPVLIEGTIRDISERKRMENALRTSEEHYRSLFTYMLEGFAYCQMVYDDSNHPIDWIYLDVNDSFEQITGLKGLKGKPVTEAIPGIWEEIPELFDIYNRVVITGVPEVFEIYFTPLHVWLKIAAYRPELGHFVAIFEDITKRKQTEENLNKILREHQSILEKVPSMIWYKDIHNTFIRVNPAAARLFGKPIHEIEGKTFSEIFPGAPDLYYSDDLEVITSKKPKLGIVERIYPFGEPIWVQTDKVPLFDDKDEVIGILVVSTDITERKKAKDAITLANKKLQLMSSITRHDVANQLQGLFFSLDLALGDELSPDGRIYIEKADTFAHNIERQISFTRDYQDIGVRSPTWQDVHSVIQQSIRSLDLGVIDLHQDFAGLSIYADPLFEKVFHNLIDNSLRYGEKITGITISGHEDTDGYILIYVDDGIGIPDKYKSAIFKREYFKHTGFGLSLSREILEITGMSIQEVGQEGEGVRFEIRIPKGEYRLNNF